MVGLRLVGVCGWGEVLLAGRWRGGLWASSGDGGEVAGGEKGQWRWRSHRGQRERFVGTSTEEGAVEVAA